MYKMAVGFVSSYGFTRGNVKLPLDKTFCGWNSKFWCCTKYLETKSQEIEVNFVITSHIAITFTIYFIKYLLSENLRQGSCSNAVDKIEMNDLC